MLDKHFQPVLNTFRPLGPTFSSGLVGAFLFFCKALLSPRISPVAAVPRALDLKQESHPPPDAEGVFLAQASGGGLGPRSFGHQLFFWTCLGSFEDLKLIRKPGLPGRRRRCDVQTRKTAEAPGIFDRAVGVLACFRDDHEIQGFRAQHQGGRYE